MGSTVDANSDTVGDFNAAIGDLIVLNLIDADGNGGNGETAFSFIGNANNPFTAAGQVSWLIGGADTYILLNTDGDAAADGVIRCSAPGSRCELVRSLTVRSLLARQRREALGFPRTGMSPFGTNLPIRNVRSPVANEGKADNICLF